ncbi:hypothetical protein SASPL_142250 [Salvia splendens]|uniref:Uncharacterized protein n=1 Tax=Salvia splendens TaxID=180675 RepID=A0A8X8WJZ9_SALSN|nr:hypothetical protein SASPL_142250 [Salvia splendens]
MGRPHVLAMPYPAQGHVIPLMELAQWLAHNGIRVTFVNTDFNHARVMRSLSSIKSDRVTCLITDYGLIWALALADKLGIKKSAFLPASVALLALARHSKSLLDDGIVDGDGTPLKEEHVIRLSPEMPAMKIQESVWLQIGNFASQQRMFQSMTRNIKTETLPDSIICNSSHELEAGALKLLPDLIAVGPLLPEDSACLSWLDRQPPNSTVYVAFGSFTLLNKSQFHELALGLERSGRPFLWVVRPDMTQEAEKCFPEGFKERVRKRGKMVGWAPQQRVLSHPSVACFVSHCGWNSTMEGVCGGVPFLCWPYFADQFLNQSYIVEVWRVGLKLEKDRSGVIAAGEIVEKVEILLGDEGYKDRAKSLGSKTVDSVREGGSSCKNLSSFVEWIKDDRNCLE